MSQEVFQELNLSEVMGERFGRYSKYIIQERAIPDVRDGLKPVQRRIIYAMYHEGNSFDKAYRKSAKTVGNVIGNYHPHGDSSVYEAMTRLSQDWKMRQPLIDMQGNNGSLDGDPPAAMRYTEARLSKIANELTAELNQDTVDWTLNFDDTEEEPTVLPARYPNLLVNGATGISAGYATDIPPHNLAEVIDACVYLLDHPKASLDELMDFVKGPDFPTGGIIQGREGLEEAYRTGRGRIVVRSKAEIEDLKTGMQRIVITEIPYDVNKANMIQQIDDIRLNKEIEGIQEVRDETDKDGLRVAIDLRKDASAEGILTYLLKNTDMQVNYNFNMVAINDKRPEQMGLVSILQAYVKYRRETVTRRTRFLLNKALKRQHIVEGLIRALSILDEIIALIRQSQNKVDAKDNLMTRFDFSEAQAEAIVSLQLYRLSNTDVVELKEEGKALDEKIKGYRLILEDERKLKQVIKDELRQSKKTFPSERRSQVEDKIESLEIKKEVLIADEEVVVTVTKQGYLKRTSQRSFGASDLGDFGLREHDYPIFARQLSTLDQVILFTNKGNAINRPVYSLPDLRWKDIGHHLSQDLRLEDNERIIKVFSLDQFDDAFKFVLATKKGFIKQCLASEFGVKKNFKSQASIAINLKDEDEVINVIMVASDALYDVFTVTQDAYGLRYELDDVSTQGARAKGVLSVNLKEGDQVIGMSLFDPFEDSQAALIISQRNYIKKINLTEFEKSKRNQRGLKVFKSLKTKPYKPIILVPIYDEYQDLTFVTTSNKQVSLQAKDLDFVDRQHKGKPLFKEEDGRVIEVQRPLLEELEEG